MGSDAPGFLVSISPFTIANSTQYEEKALRCRTPALLPRGHNRALDRTLDRLDDLRLRLRLGLRHQQLDQADARQLDQGSATTDEAPPKAATSHARESRDAARLKTV